MTSAPAVPRHNPHTGMDCPPWCEVDHATCATCVGSGGPFASPFDVWARAVLGPHHAGSPVVTLTGAGGGKGRTYHLELRPRLAEDLAGLVELLAAATPDQHRELAAAIRKAAADITEAGAL